MGTHHPTNFGSSRFDTVLVTRTDYTAAGNVEDVIDPKGIATEYAYDMLGRTLQESDGIGGGSWVSQTNYTYDGNDDVLTAQAVYPGTTTPGGG
jgi:YD repeat-containing protein